MLRKWLVVTAFAAMSSAWATIITVEDNGEVSSHSDPEVGEIPVVDGGDELTLGEAVPTSDAPKSQRQASVSSEQPDSKGEQERAKDGTKVVHAITEITFGNPKLASISDRVVEVYISPTCLHCGHFLSDEFEQFVRDHNDDLFIKLILLPASAKDLFVMKLIQREVLDANGFFLIFKNFIRRALATFDHISPSSVQKKKFRGSNSDPDMIKYQVIASEFGFSDEKIVQAIPNMDEDYEKAVVRWYKSLVKHISGVLNTKNLNLPMIFYQNRAMEKLKNIALPS